MTVTQIILFSVFAIFFVALLWGRWRFDLVAFAALVAAFGLDDPVLLRLARLVDEADVPGEVSVEPAAPGLDLICRGLRRTSADDPAAVERAILLYEALYAELAHG